jgi:calcineurin-like phosphoesterase family protein
MEHHALKNFSPIAASVPTHEDYIRLLIARWNSVVGKGDTVWVLGDIAKNNAGLIRMEEFHGQKNLVRGNHDSASSLGYLRFFQTIHGILKKYGFWISHCPIHPDELRGHKNIHGHVHQNEIKISGTQENDPRYIYVGADKLDGYPISLDEIIQKYGDK